jgi:hypothetical protein
MIIKLTNSFPQYKGLTVLINTDFLVNAITNKVTRDDGTIETVTTIHCPPHGVWEVEETPEQIYDLINGNVATPPKKETLLLEKVTPKAKGKTKKA